MTKLLSCPFCGNPPCISGPCNDAPEEDLFLNSFQVVCSTCCSGPNGETEEDAIKRWNARYSDKIPRKWWEELREYVALFSEDPGRGNRWDRGFHAAYKLVAVKMDAIEQRGKE